MKITLIAGARPNFIKIAPIINAIEAVQAEDAHISYRLIHTGQHYDARMSDNFFTDLNIPQPDVNLECGGGTQAEQTAAIMIAFEAELIANPADYVLVVGDVTSTMACSIVAKKMQTKVIHVEAGIRSGDITMPEEINRMVTDSITDIFFTTTPQASENLFNLGIPKDKVHWVGNVMIDTLRTNEHRLTKPACWQAIGLDTGKYFVMTMHRPANVDEGRILKTFVNEIAKNAGDANIVFPIHPRTKRVFEEHGIRFTNIHTIDPLGYLEFNYLVKNSLGVITDSGGITEETTVMGVPCITLRDNTERPETVALGTNELIGTNPSKIGPAIKRILSGEWKKGSIPEKWDGLTSQRIIEIMKRYNIKKKIVIN
jgi:UDP-N-acetylglucosamine 2-epimerase (non-hydrolysing)